MVLRPPIHDGVRYHFWLKRVESSHKTLEVLHYTRYEFDVSGNTGKSIFAPESICFDTSRTEEEDCKVDKNVTALVFSGNDMAKNVAEIVQNAVDTTLTYFGGCPTGGWGDGFKMSVARSLNSGNSIEIITLKGVRGKVKTSVLNDGSKMIVQNCHTADSFSDSSMYIGHSTKPSKKHSVKGDMIQQMEILSGDCFDGSPVDFLKARKEEGHQDIVCTTCIFKPKEASFAYDMNMAWLKTSLEEHKSSSKHSTFYNVLRTTDICIDVTVCRNDSNVLETLFFQNGIFVSSESFNILVEGAFVGSIIFSITSNVPFVKSRDRTFDPFAITRVRANKDLFSLESCDSFVRDFLFNEEVMKALHLIQNSSLNDLLRNFVDTYHLQLRTKWRSDSIPVETDCLVKKWEEIMKGGEYRFLVAPKYFFSLFEKKTS
jgi:hypothetical protein